MPELPEVETVVRSLRPQLTGRTILVFEPIWPKVIEAVLLDDFTAAVEGQKIRDVTRRGKFILLNLDSVHLAVHLRMTGTLFITRKPVTDFQHITAVFHISAGEKLFFRDTRKFGRIYLYRDLEVLDRKLGIEPLGGEFTAEWLQENLRIRKRKMKALLLDQTFLAGLGNIYADEVLWRAKIHPLKLSNTVSSTKTKELHEAIGTILADAIAANGTTIRDFTFQDKQTGGFNNELQVFQKEDSACPRCSTTIRKIRAVGRGTHICPRCQRQ